MEIGCKTLNFMTPDNKHNADITRYNIPSYRKLYKYGLKLYCGLD